MMKGIRFDINGKVAIVTGGNRGIGFGISWALAEEGCKVVIANRNAAAGEEAARKIRKDTGGTVRAIPVDVADKKSVEQMVEKTLEEFGQIDILVNNAGVREKHYILDMPEEEWNYVMDINTKGPFLVSQAVGKHMTKRKRGKIVNITSIMECLAKPGRAVYCTSKGALAQFTKALSLEWAQYSINVNAVAPALVVTPENRPHLEADPKRFQAMCEQHPIGRVATPEDIVGTVLFLASSASNYITGQTIFVDGGRKNQ